MDTPVAPLPQNSFADFVPEPAGPAAFNPDDPPWGVGAGFLVWLASVFVMFALQVLAVVPYMLYAHRQEQPAKLGELMSTDPNALLVGIVAVIPAHILTLVMVWALVTNYGKRPFGQTVGWGWSPRFGLWASAGLALALLLFGIPLLYFLGGEKTPFDQMLESSTQARFATAFLATASAPLVEELVYRGVLYPALQRALGALWAVLVVGSLFTLVHVAQYYNNAGVIAAVGTLGFVLTVVRARTGRVLPCFVIHLVFNGLQVAGLVLEYFHPVKQ